MKNILDEIIDHKRKEVQLTSVLNPLSYDRSSALKFRSLATALSTPGIQVIAEIKLKSPSSGDIQTEVNPVKIAQDYESAGAAAISVLTDNKYFGGNLEILRQVRQSVSIPVLRKDFIISDYQLYESAEAGADAILLIAEALTNEKMFQLYSLAQNLGLDVLVEFHSSRYLPLISDLNPGIVGLNCRDLTTMTVDLKRFELLLDDLPKDAINVAESGIYTAADLKYVSRLGYNAALIGTSLMKTHDPGATLKQLLETHK
ncbi:MAG: indole-3-glycerol phosphate synthase TrpC [Fidelibacterota bacterium]